MWSCAVMRQAPRRDLAEGLTDRYLPLFRRKLAADAASSKVGPRGGVLLRARLHVHHPANGTLFSLPAALLLPASLRTALHPRTSPH
jgi:hypothetical protein